MHSGSIVTEIQDKLQSYWQTFILSIPRLAIAIIILTLFAIAAAFIGKLVRRRVNRSDSNSLIADYVVKLSKVILILMGLILAMNTLGFENTAGGLLAGAGVGAIIIGFAFKEVGENFLAGMILIFDRPFHQGDTISVNNVMGVVRELRFRTTHVKTFDGKDVYIPNATIIRNELYNHTQDGYLRLDFVIGIDYNVDIDHATNLALEIITQHPQVIRSDEAQVLVDEFGPSTVNLRMLFWVDTVDYGRMANQLKSDIMRDVKRTMLREGVGLPSNIQEIKMYNDSRIPLDIHTATTNDKPKG